jgi:hypothetical protein
MAKKVYTAEALTGGAANSLDFLGSTSLNDDDLGIVATAELAYFYRYESASTATENTPTVVTPDDSSGAGRWLLLDVTNSVGFDDTPKRSRFRWKDGNEIYIGGGRYPMYGTVQQNVRWNMELTYEFGSTGSNSNSDDLGNSETHYLYLADAAAQVSNVTTSATAFLNDTQAPGAYDHEKKGHYWGSNLCLGAFRTSTAGAILEFYHDGDYFNYGDYVLDHPGAVSSTNWTDEATLTVPSFVRRAQATFRLFYGVGSTAQTLQYLAWRTDGSASTKGHLVAYASSNTLFSYCSVPVICSSAFKIDIAITKASTADMVQVFTNGWYFPEGM